MTTVVRMRHVVAQQAHRRSSCRIGPFRYHGTRSDDPNDVIPHEHRRELRGLRLFAAWTNHDDTRAQNTQASWVAADGTHHIRHWLIDFGSTFGSGSVDLQLPNLSFHYWLPLDQVKKNALGFGFHTPAYRKVDWPNFPKFEGSVAGSRMRSTPSPGATTTRIPRSSG